MKPSQSDDVRDLIRDAEFNSLTGNPCKLKLVLYTIYNRGTCFATLDTLADDCSMSRSTLKRCLKVLEEAEVIITQHERATLKSVNTKRAIRSISADKLRQFRMTSRVHSDEPMNVESQVHLDGPMENSSQVQNGASWVQNRHPIGSPGWTSKPNPINQNTKSKDSWLRISKRLVGLGLKSHGCLDAAKQAGCEPELISELIDHWKQNRDAYKWGPGALYDRIERANPTDEIWSGWVMSVPKSAPPPIEESTDASGIKCPKCANYHPNSIQAYGFFQCGSCNQPTFMEDAA